MTFRKIYKEIAYFTVRTQDQKMLLITKPYETEPYHCEGKSQAVTDCLNKLSLLSFVLAIKLLFSTENENIICFSK